jgi:RimJ/RimL family protein N-acetyltransferase
LFRLDTRRLILVSAPIEVLKTRLEWHDGFAADITVPASRDDASPLRVHARFPAEWPGPDALDAFPLWMTQLATDPRFDRWGGVGVMLARDGFAAVGGMGCKGPPNATGMVEIGYGVNPAYQGRGYATETAAALVDWLGTQPEVRRVTAECLASNHASARVLEKVGFARVGLRSGAEGTLIVWERVPPLSKDGRVTTWDGTPL